MNKIPTHAGDGGDIAREASRGELSQGIRSLTVMLETVPNNAAFPYWATRRSLRQLYHRLGDILGESYVVSSGETSEGESSSD